MAIQMGSTFYNSTDGSTVSSTFSTPTSSSNWVGGNELVSSGSWSQLTFNSGSLTNVIGFYVANNYNNLTQYSQSIVGIATSSLGAGLIAMVYPGQIQTIGWSGSFNNSNGVYVSVVGSFPYGLPLAGTNAGTASIQWKTVQS